MKVKHFFMLIATLFLPACNNSNSENQQQNNNLEDLSIDENIDSNNPGNTSKNNNSRLLYPVSEGRGVREYAIIADDGSPVESINVKEPELLSTYTTKVYTKTNARVKNLQIACSKVNNYIIGPNEEFSYNNVAGPYDAAHGFGKATIFVGKKDVQEYGGGVCQVSSTLYNAVKNCGIEILERHNHSKDVYYVPRNEDATISYGNLDFRFKNINNYSLKIVAESNRDSCTVSIYKV